MNKVGNWLRKNKDKFYQDNPKLSPQQNFMLWEKYFEYIWRKSEVII